MGIEIIRLGEKQDEIDKLFAVPSMAELSFQTHQVPNPPMSIWMMSASIGKAPLPWWKYDAKIDVEINKLSQEWNITSAQSLFDCLYLSQLRLTAGNNFYVIFPGNLKTESWEKLLESDQFTYSRGQACVYHLEGAYDGKLAI